MTRDQERYLREGYTEPPQPSVAIFSSFCKFLREVGVVRNVFLEHGIYVSNPPSLEPINPGAEYVRFPEDDPSLSDGQIQRRVIGTAMLSTAIYVVCPNGYVGSLASYEIGWANSGGANLYFSELPRAEEPILQPLAEGRIVDPHELSHMVLENRLTPLPDPYTVE